MRQNTDGLTLVGLFMEGTILTCLETYSDAQNRTMVRSGLSSMRPRIIGGNGNLRGIFFPATATERMSRRHAERVKLSWRQGRGLAGLSLPRITWLLYQRSLTTVANDYHTPTLMKLLRLQNHALSAAHYAVIYS
jgi:hypothetical protein